MGNIIGTAQNKDLCYGCGACKAICPMSAIEMKPDAYGNLYPEVDTLKCVDCSMCSRVCCADNAVKKAVPKKVLAATYKNSDISMKSSSGGVFAALAESVLSKNGIVFGTAFDEQFDAKVVGINSIDELYKIQGSKYVRSSKGFSYKQIEKELKTGRTVLFCGIPCQVAAVKQYIGKEYKNLILADVVCHGTPNNQMFIDYLKYIQNKKKSRIVEYRFRDKENGQDTKGKVVYKQKYFGKEFIKKKTLKAYLSSYYKLFLNCATFRESCYCCQFADSARLGDITLCDYWGVNEIHPEFVKDVKAQGLCGISAVMINTQKGMDVIEDVMTNLLYIATDYDDVKRFNPQLNQPSRKTTEHEEIMELYSKKGYEAVDKYYYQKYNTAIIVSTIGQFLPEIFKKKILNIKRKIMR